MEFIHPSVLGVGREEANPFWCVQLLTILRSIGPSISSSPGRTFPGPVEDAKLRAARKGSPSNVQQGGWDTYLFQCSTLGKGFLLNSSQLAGETELLQVQAMCKGRSQDLRNYRSGEIN